MTIGDRVAVMRRGELEHVDTPQQLYDRPANLFVGDFIGSPAMNMVEATLEPSNGTLAAAVGSQRIVLGDEKLNAHPALRASEGRTVILGIRPEDLEDAALAPETAPLDPEPQNPNDAAVDAGSTSERRRDEARCHRRTRLHRVDARRGAYMTEWLAAIVVALVVFGLAMAAVGLIAYIRLVDPFRVDVASWIGDLTQGVIVLVATLAFLALAFVSGEPYAYVAAAATACVEGVAIWLLSLSRFREAEAPARTTASANARPLPSAGGSKAPGSAAVDAGRSESSRRTRRPRAFVNAGRRRTERAHPPPRR
jgi:hypothetical protein